MSLLDWQTPDPHLREMVDHYRETCLSVYAQDRNRVTEDLRKEFSIAEGGYGRKQVQELLQNGADALHSAPGRLAVELSADTLYVANQGSPFSADGLRGILYAHLSEKTGEEIGRFGLGFKSIAGISDNPQVFSQSVSFTFDRELSQRSLSETTGELFDKYQVPALRIAWPMEPTQEFDDDPVLRNLAKWATTIIKVPLLPGAAVELDEEIREFDESFCLFVPSVKELVISSEISKTHKRFTVSRGGEQKREVELQTSDGSSARWYVITKEYKPSDAALENAGRTSRRETIEVSWAVPLEGRARVGNLSAYFPVKSEVSLSGKLNAPWKLSDDRIDLIAGAFNQEILETVVPDLVAEARQFLGPLDPGRYVDILPARGRELKSWADGVINGPIYRKLRNTRCIPNANSDMRSPNSVHVLPPVVPSYVANDWMEIVTDRSHWVHPDCTSTPERRSKTYRLLNIDKVHELDKLGKWLESFTSDGLSRNAADKSNAALHAVTAIQDEADPKFIDDVGEIARMSQIVLLESGAWARPSRSQAVLRSSVDDRGQNFVHPGVSDDDRSVQTLKELGVAQFEQIGQIGDVVEQLRISTGRSADWWEDAWTVFRTTDIDDLKLEFNAKLPGDPAKYIKIKNLAGEWVLPSGHYVAGSLLKPNHEDSQLLADHRFHAPDSAVLRLLGVADSPFTALSHTTERWFREFREAHEEEIGNALHLNRRSMSEFDLDLPVSLGPLDNLHKFSPANRARLTHFVIARTFSSQVKARSRKNSLTTDVLHPHLWKAIKDGLLRTTIGFSPVEESLLGSEETNGLEDILPVVPNLDITPEIAAALPFKRDAAEYSVNDFEKLILLHRGNDDEVAVGKTYGWYCYFHTDSMPAQVSVKANGEWKSLPPSQVAVASDPMEEASLEKFGIPTLPVPTPQDSEYLNDFWKLLIFSEIPLVVEFEQFEDPEPLLFKFPNLLSLSVDLEDEDFADSLERYEFQPCLSLDLVSQLPGMPRSRNSVTRTIRNDVLYVVGKDIREQLNGILKLLGVHLDEYRFEQLVEESESQQLEIARANLRAAEDDATRLSLLFAKDELISQIPAQALENVMKSSDSELSDRQLAQVCIDMFGPASLERLTRGKTVLPVGVPPKSWRGSYSTRNWVRKLGFSEEWAGRKTKPSNGPTEIVGGPADPGRFHDYQKAVSENLRRMLNGFGPQRGLITLPTGAGKTRVAVQTIIEAIAAGDLDEAGTAFNGPILWLVNNEELCEQAIEAWGYLWSAVGRQNTSLTISRHFSQHSAVEEPTGVQVVVGTYQKTVLSTGQPEYDWLKETPLVVIDEAHSALNPTYTKILQWTGRSSRERDKLLVGLTATPFIGRADSESTEQLRKRFDNNILDQGVFGTEKPMVRLQRDRVLSHVTMELIHSTSAIELSHEEQEEFRKTAWLPKRKESELGLDLDRTLRIVESIKSKPDHWSIIVFATSVENAETIAAMLTLDGIPSAAISSSTPASERAVALERFRSRELRVLTNYSVLSQGFDAPKTDAVYITRPTQSEVRYQQMIGRGLRGPKNGGTEEVHLVNVLDNIREFDLSINYKRFEMLADSVDEG